jgi:uncharacterized membrane protein
MTRTRVRAAIVVAIVLAGLRGVTGQGRALVYSTFDFPGAVLTNAQGINAQGEIVGLYTDTAGKTHGFIRSGEHYRSVDFPEAGATQLRGISQTGDMVGSYQRSDESGGLPVHGFLMTRRGTFFKVDYPGHANTIAQRILADGTILGCYHDTDTMGTMHGFIVTRRGFDAIPEVASMHNGATPDGKLIVGLFTDMMDNRGKAYIVDRGRFSPFEVPGSSFTAGWDVNPSGVIVGVYRDSAGLFHGFQYDGQAVTRVDVPGASATRVFGINANSDMTGAFVDASGRTHGFLAQWTPR